jgi:arabinofuranosyltransferase
MPPTFDRRARLLVLAALAAAAAIAGWRLFYFLTDDAFIAFRYASNSLLGRGLVWNPPPFRPVEGYTSWLWVVLLREVWRATGVAPPDAANWISLGFGLATLWLGWHFVERMALPPGLARRRLALLALVWLGTIGNRTFLAWLSSGLETALFDFLFTLWIYHALAPPERRGRGHWPWLSLSAALAALARPDGWLAVAATPLLLALDRRAGARRSLAGALPLAAPFAHLLWRRATYGEWLPNTWYAKQVAAWPESGLRYAACFALEYAVWIWLLLALAWLVRDRRLSREGALVIGVLGLHFAYYTLAVGGDHFEYRVYSHLVLLLFVSGAWLAARVAPGPRTALALLGAFVAASWPLPWIHWLETREIRDREVAFQIFRPVAPRLPPGLRAYGEGFDAMQRWLIAHYVGLRHQEHKVFAEFQQRRFPTRIEGSRIGWEERAVAELYSVGVAGWVLPHVAIIDQLGLNDWVVARNPDVDLDHRTMAHDRRAPRGYVRCFRPNVFDDGRELVHTPRPEPLRDDEIRACEEQFAEWVRERRGDPP